MTTRTEVRVGELARKLRQRLGDSRYDLWFAKNTRFSIDGCTLAVGVSKRHLQEWLQRSFGADVLAVASDVLGAAAQVRFVIDGSLFQAARQEESEAVAPVADMLLSLTEPRTVGPCTVRRSPAIDADESSAGSAEPLMERPETDESSTGAETSEPLDIAAEVEAAFAEIDEGAETESVQANDLVPSVGQDPRADENHANESHRASASRPLGASGLRRRGERLRRLEDFVVGPCNRVAHAAATMLIESPADAPSPLVFHGPMGTGKTHLLEGLYVGLRQAAPDANVVFLTAEEFTNRFVQAMHQNKLAAFRKQFRSCDALLVDNVQFLARKKATCEEFLHTVDSLLADGRIVVAACDSHPRLADTFPAELKDRLAGGAVWGLTTPDPSTRLSILRTKSQRLVPMPGDVLHFLAQQLRGNVRELEGALHAIAHLARVVRRVPDLDMVRSAVSELLRHSIRIVHLEDVQRATCQVFGISAEELQSKRRSAAATAPRMLAMLLARKRTAATYGDIGKFFGGRNHSTVVAQERRAKQMLAEGATLRLGGQTLAVADVLDRIERILQSVE